MSTTTATTAPEGSPDRASIFRATPVFLAFLAMGFGDAADALAGLAKQQFHLSNLMAQLMPFAGYIMFGVLSVPLGVVQDKRGKKFVLVLGLAIMLSGVLIPTIAGLTSYTALILTVLLVGAGATILQVAGNPLMRDVSPEGKYSRNLSFGQFVKAIGSMAAALIALMATRYLHLSWHIMFPIFSVALAIALIAGATLNVKSASVGDERAATLGACLRLLSNRYVLWMVSAIFLYVGAEASAGSGIPLFLKGQYGINIATTALIGNLVFFLALTIGRFSGGVILNWMKPRKFLLWTCIVSILGLLLIFAPSSSLAYVGFFVIGLGFANIFPLIFSITVDQMPGSTNALSGLMIMAIAGGAILPPLMGKLGDVTHSMQIGFLVPLAAILYITLAAVLNLKSRTAGARAD